MCVESWYTIKIFNPHYSMVGIWCPALEYVPFVQYKCLRWFLSLLASVLCTSKCGQSECTYTYRYIHLHGTSLHLLALPKVELLFPEAPVWLYIRRTILVEGRERT